MGLRILNHEEPPLGPGSAGGSGSAVRLRASALEDWQGDEAVVDVVEVVEV
jgi:hypothetical protein